MKNIILLVTIFFFSAMMNAQDYSNKYCNDITSKVTLEKLPNAANEVVILLNVNDTLRFQIPKGDFEILGAVINNEESIIDIVYRMPAEQFENIISFMGLVKNGIKWELGSNIHPVSSRYFNKEIDLVDIAFPDIHTLLVRYKKPSTEIVDRLFRITSFGLVEYDCFGKTSAQRENSRNLISGDIGDGNTFRPTN